jgi:ubiquinone/menaquinone biosynthesis C-methylase UbiE
MWLHAMGLQEGASMTTETIDQAKAEAFAGQMIGMLNSAGLAVLTSIGHRTGLFDAMATLAPSTSQQIAGAAGLNERYVREWLGAMTTGKIVEYDAGRKTYRLPPEHAGSITRAAGPGNIASFMQFVALMGNVETKVADCFRKGGGVPYSEYPEFQQLMAENSARVHDATLVSVILPLVPGLVARLQSGIDVMDVGCGQGHAINLMAKEFPASRFTGVDFSDEGIAAGKAEAKALGLKNSSFVAQDAAKLDTSKKYDLITSFDSVHDQAHPDRMLKGISDSLKPGGVYLCVDVAASSNLEDNIDHPMGPFLYTASTLHCMTVSLAYGGAGLGTVWGEQKAREMLTGAGFKAVDVKQVEGDILNNYYIATKD